MDFMKRLVLLIEVSGSSLDRANNNMARRKTWLVFTPFFSFFLGSRESENAIFWWFFIEASHPLAVYSDICAPATLHTKKGVVRIETYLNFD